MIVVPICFFLIFLLLFGTFNSVKYAIMVFRCVPLGLDRRDRCSVIAARAVLDLAVEEIVPEAHNAKESRWATACFIGGFALFALLASYLGN